MSGPTLGLAVSTDALTNDLVTAIEAAACDLGIETRMVTDRASAAGRDVIIAVGYPEYYPWLSAPTPGTRRILWIGEPLPPPGEPVGARIRRRLPMGRILDGVVAAGRIAGWISLPARLAEQRERAAVDHDRRISLAAHRRALQDGFELVVTSTDRAASLANRGIPARVVPYGYHPVMAGRPQDVDDGQRDIDVLVLATAATGVPTRRARILAATLAALDPSLRTELVEHGLFGPERQLLLRRTRIVLNVHRVAGNFTGIRVILAPAAGALVVSEPIDAPAPFVPGVHYVEAASDDLATTITRLLADRDRRLDIARSGQRFVVEQMTMARSLERVLGTVP